MRWRLAAQGRCARLPGVPRPPCRHPRRLPFPERTRGSSPSTWSGGTTPKGPGAAAEAPAPPHPAAPSGRGRRAGRFRHVARQVRRDQSIRTGQPWPGSRCALRVKQTMVLNDAQKVSLHVFPPE